MRETIVILVLLGLMGLVGSCGKDQSQLASKTDQLPATYSVAAPRKEIIAPHVLSAQLAPHNQVEAKTTFARTEPIQASVYLTNPSYIESRRIFAFLVNDEAVVEEQSIAVGATDERQEFDFSFAKTPRPLGSYQIRFVEIARSNAKPVLLARLFLNVE
jgi:hypothetical protein